jgi:WhiB family redox-sensing transcriptional regulator
MSGDGKRALSQRAAERIAAELGDLAAVPDEVLADLVTRRCRCLWEITYGDPPRGTSEDAPDRELAARLCEGCPGRRECLEFELRTAGDQSIGVWGGLNEDDRRAVYAVWRARAWRGSAGTHQDGTDEEGGQES